MVISTPVKAASGLALTSAGAAGAALAYKYSTDLYAIEKLALDEKAIWKIKVDSSTPAFFTVVVSAASPENLAENYGVAKTTAEWSCIVKTTSAKTEELKKKLKEKFGNLSDISTEGTNITSNNFDLSKKQSFLNSCSRNRKQDTAQKTPNKDKVVSELILPEATWEVSLNEVFGGSWINAKSESTVK